MFLVESLDPFMGRGDHLCLFGHCGKLFLNSLVVRGRKLCKKILVLHAIAGGFDIDTDRVQYLDEKMKSVISGKEDSRLA